MPPVISIGRRPFGFQTNEIRLRQKITDNAGRLALGTDFPVETVNPFHTFMPPSPEKIC